MIVAPYKVAFERTHPELGIILFHPETHDEIINVLENARLSLVRVRLWYGNVSTGRAWDEYVEGKLGRSGGIIPALTIATHRKCLGCREVLTHCIIKVEYANKQRGGVLWTHPDFKRADAA